MTAPPVFEIESLLEKAPGRSAHLRAEAQKAKDAGDFAGARSLTLAAEGAEREESEAAERLKQKPNIPRPMIAGSDATRVAKPPLPPRPQPSLPAPPVPAAPDQSALIRQEFTLRQKGAAMKDPLLLAQAEQIKAQRTGQVTVGPVQPVVGPRGGAMIPEESMAEIGAGEYGLAPQIQAGMRSGEPGYQNIGNLPSGADPSDYSVVDPRKLVDPTARGRVSATMRKKTAPGAASTALNIALTNAMSPISPEAASSATDAALERFTEGGGDASEYANLFGLAASGGEVLGSGPLLKGPSIAAKAARKVAPGVAEGAQAGLRDLARRGEVVVASRAQRAAQRLSASAPAVKRVAKEAFKTGAEVGATMATVGAAGDLATDQEPLEMGKRAAERVAAGTLLGAALKSLPLTMGEVSARRAGRRAVERLPEELKDFVAGEKMRRASRGTEEVAAAPEPGYTGRTNVARRPSIYDIGAETTQRVAEVRETAPGYAPTPRFYSRLEKAIEAAPFEKGTAEQWRAALTKNVAKSEREYTGVEKFLEGNAGKVLTRAEVQGAFVRGKIKLTESVNERGEEGDALAARSAEVGRELNNSIQDLRHHVEQYRWSQGKIATLLDELSSPTPVGTIIREHGLDAPLARIAREIKEKYQESREVQQRFDSMRGSLPKFENYTEPGGENYREILLQEDRETRHSSNVLGDWLRKERGFSQVRVSRILSDPMLQREFREDYERQTGKQLPAESGPEQFQSSHFDQPNILAHARVKDRTLPNGEKALFVEEIQPDWHQRGRERGYTNTKNRAEVQAREQEAARHMRTAIERTLESLEAEADHETAQIMARELGGTWIPRVRRSSGENMGFKVTPELREKVLGEGQPVLSPTTKYQPTTAAGKKIQLELGDLGDGSAPAAAALEEHLAAVEKPPQIDMVKRGLLRRVPGLKAWALSRKTLTELMKKRHSEPIIGKRFQNEEDLAVHAQIFRDPRFETLRVIYVKGDEIVAVEGLSQRLPNAAAFAHYGSQEAAVGMVRTRLEALGADGFYFQHNHPTGDPTPSGIDPKFPGDVQFQAYMTKEMGPALKGHIIINSGQYTTFSIDFDADGKTFYPRIKTAHFDPEKTGVPRWENDPLHKPDPGLEHPQLREFIGGPEDLARLAKDAEMGNDHVLLYHQDAKGRVTALQEVPFELIKTQTLALREKTFEWAKHLGAVQIFAVSANPAHKAVLGSMVQTGDFRDAAIVIRNEVATMVQPASSAGVMGSPGFSQLEGRHVAKANASDTQFGKIKEDAPRYRREGAGEEYEAPVDEGEDPRLVNLAKFDLDPGGEKRLRKLIEDKGYTKKRVTHAETIEVAKELGLDPQRLIRNVERRLSGAELLAIRDAISENVDAMESASKVLTDPNSLSPQRDEAAQLMARLHDQTEQFTSRFIREREQTGRDLNALKIIAQRTMDPAVWLVQAERIKGLALTPEEMVEITTLAKGQQRPELMSFVSSLHRSTKLDKFLTLWKAGLLTAPVTHVANIAGNVSMAALETAKEPLAMVIDATISMIRGEAMAKSPSFRGLFTEQVKGTWRGAKAAKQIFKTGITPQDASKWNLAGKTNYNNAILQAYSDLVFNSLSAEDQVFKGASFGRHLEEYSRLRAKEISRKSKGAVTFKDALADIRQNVPNDVLLKAIAGAEFDTFQNDNPVSSGIQAFNRAVSRTSVLRTGSTITMPFIKTPTNVIARLFDYTPAGFFKLLDSEVRGDQKQLSEALARAGLGSGLMWYGVTLAAAGLATGAIPENQAEREAWNAEGKLPNALKISGKWRQIGRITPAGMLVALGAQLHNAWAKAENTTEAVSGGLAATGRLITDQPFLQGISRTLGALSDPANEGKRFIENTAGSVVPAIVGRAARGLDTKEREARGIVDIVKSRIPGARESLPAKRDIFGEEVPNRQSFAGVMFDPTSSRKDTTTPLLAEMERLGVTPMLPSSQVRDSTAGKKEQRKRTPEERRNWLTDVGPELKKSLTLLIANEAYKALPDDQKEDLFRTVQERVRREGRDREVATREAREGERSPAEAIVRESVEAVAETIQNKAEREKILTLAKAAAKEDFAPLVALPDSTKEKLGKTLISAQRDTVRKELDRLLAAATLDPEKLKETAARYEALGGDVEGLVKRWMEREGAVRATVDAARALRK